MISRPLQKLGGNSPLVSTDVSILNNIKLIYGLKNIRLNKFFWGGGGGE